MCNVCLITMLVASLLKVLRDGYICLRQRRNFNKKHCSSLNKSSMRRRVETIVNLKQCWAELRYLKKLRNMTLLLKY